MGGSISVIGALVLPLAGAAMAWGAIRLLFPLLQRYALARPNARSSHKVPTAQGGGAAVIAAALAVAWAGLAWFGFDADGFSAGRMGLLTVAVAGLAIIGAVDDVRPLPVGPRLIGQFIAAGLVLAALPAPARVIEWLPWVVEVAVLVVGLVWFVNLTNFMDGIDGITLAEMLPVSAAAFVLAQTGAAPQAVGIVALALIGGLTGFAPYNRHVARLFLGDVGSLPIGAVIGWMLIAIACRGHLAAALLLPLYYLADATITLWRRWRRGERLSQAHRSHFYQLAVQRGVPVPQITRRILALNVLLAVAAVASTLTPAWGDALLLAFGTLATSYLLRSLDDGRSLTALAR